MIEFIKAGSGDYLGLNNLDRIKCPDCNRSFLERSKFHSTKLLCYECGLEIDERELNRESKYIPEFGQFGKPFDNQVTANKKYIDPGQKQAFVIDSSDEQKLADISLKGLGKSKTGAEVSSRKDLSPATEAVVKDLVQKLGPGKDVKVSLA
jgi:hypothetical protein